MRQQGSLITTLLVILESIAVVGFLFLIFAVSSSSNIGKYEYRLQIKSSGGELQPLASAVIWAVDKEKQLSFHTDEQGISHFRTRHSLDSVTVSASNHFTQSFFVDEAKEGAVYESTFVLKTVEKETADTLTQTIKTIAVIDEQKQPITNALVTLISESPAQSFQYDLTHESYPLLITDLKQDVRYSVSAPGYVARFDVAYNEFSPVVMLKRQPNLNFPYEFRVSVYDQGENASFSALDDLMMQTDAVSEKTKKALDTATLFVDQGAVIKNALGSFQIFSRKAENVVEVHAPQYLSQNLNLIHERQGDNHYRVFLKKDQKLFSHQIVVKTHDNNSPISAHLQTEAKAAIQKTDVGVYQIHTSESSFQLKLEAAGYKSQEIDISPEKQKSYQVAMQPIVERTYSVRVTGREEQPIADAVVTILGNQPRTKRTDEKGIAVLKASDQVSKALLAAPGYITQTVDLPTHQMQESLVSASYQLKVNPMSDITHTIRVTVVNEEGKLLTANVSGNAGFVSQEKSGIYKILSPTLNLKMNVSAPGYQERTIWFSEKNPRDSLTIMMKKLDEQVDQMSEAAHTIQVYVQDEAGNPLAANVASTTGFVAREDQGAFKIYSSSYDMQINVSAPGFEHHIETLSQDTPKDSLNITLKKEDEQIGMMASAKHTFFVNVTDEQNNLLNANVTSTEGFVSRKKDGSYRIFSPVRNLKMDVSAAGYEPQSMEISEVNPKNSLTIALKKVGEQVDKMASAKQTFRVQVVNKQGKLLAANVASSAGFVSQNADGTYQIFSPTRDLKLNVSAAGYRNRSLDLAQKDQSALISVLLEKVDENVEQMAHATKTIHVKILNEKGELLNGNVASTAGFVAQKAIGIYQIFSPTRDLNVKVSAPGYEHQTVELSKSRPQNSLTIALKKVDERINRIASAKHTVEVKVTNSKGKLLAANLTSNAGFITRKTEGTFEIFSPTRELKVAVSADGFQPQTVALPKSKNSMIIKLKELDERIHQMSDATHLIRVKVLDDQGKPLEAAVASTAGFVSQGRSGTFKIFSPTYDMRVKVSAPGFEHKTISLTQKKPQQDLTVKLKKTEKGVVLNTEVGDRLILSKGVVYRVVQPIDQKTVKVFRRTSPDKEEFNDYPEGQVMSLAKFNREIELEKNRKNFFDENVWVTVYALDRNEYFLFKDVYRKQWSEYKLVYANHR
ncbi:MAG: hypothetical protein HQM13_16510 [SAR324 cluster bacterium]|nr:hypothetical protein [SAR324 cluster bacterium]